MAYDILKASTQSPLVFLMVDNVDHVTGKTGLSPAVVIAKNGGSFASAAGATTSIGNGWYQVAGNATDTDTAGPLILHATATSADATDTVYAIVAYNPQNANLSMANVSSNVVQWSGTNVATPATNGVPEVNIKAINNVAASGVTAVNPNIGQTQPINFTGTGASALVKIDMVDVAGAAVSTASAQIGVNVVTYASGQAPLQPTTAGRTLDVTTTGEAGIDWSNIGAPTTTVNLSGTTISTVSGNLGGTINGLTATAAANFFNVDSTTTYASAVAGSVVKEIADNAGGSSLTVGAIVNGVWDEARAGHTTAGTFGQGEIVAGYLSGQTPLQPTVAGRTLDVSAGGEAGLDWANVGSPTTTLDLSGTTIKNLDNNVTIDKTGYSLVAGYDPAKTASQAGDAMALTVSERNSTADAILARTMGTESYAAKAATPTVKELLYMLLQYVQEYAITSDGDGTATGTIKKLDGTTAALTLSIDSDTTPTLRTRDT